MRPYKMVRGLCPRDWMRWVVDGSGRTVGNAGAVGHAAQMRLAHPGNPAAAAHRGRCALRAVTKPALRHGI